MLRIDEPEDTHDGSQGRSQDGSQRRSQGGSQGGSRGGSQTGIQGWQRNLRIIWIAEFVALAGFTVYGPFLPLYIRELGLTDERQVRLWSGIIFSAPAATMAIFSPIWGALSDRYGRKIMFERAAFGGALVTALMGLAGTVQQLALLRLVQGILAGTVTAATVLVATTVPKKRVGSSLGMLQMAIYAGSSAGPFLGGFVADYFGYRLAFYVTSAMLLLTGLSVLFFVRERVDPERKPAGRRVEKRTSSLPKLSRLNLTALNTVRPRAWLAAPGSTLLLGVFAISLLARLGPRIVSPILTLFVEALAPSSARVASLAGLVSGTSAAAGAVGAWLLGRLSDRIGPQRVMLGCIATSAVAYVLQSMAPTVAVLAGLQIVAGFAIGGILASLSAYLASLAPQGQEGTIYGINASVSSVANAVGPILGSALSVWVGLRFPFLVAGGVAIIAGATAALVGRREAGAEHTTSQ